MANAHQVDAPADFPWFPHAVMLLTAVCFSTNLIFGRFVISDTAPFLLAATRWFVVGLILLPFAWPHIRSGFSVISSNIARLLLLASLGMGICGGVVYLGVQNTTATNATLIYSVAPLVIMLLETVLRGRATTRTEVFGSLIALSGVILIVLRADIATLVTFRFNVGDIFIAIATVSWAFYSLLYKSTDLSNAKPIAIFCVLAFLGAFVNAPIAIWELSSGATLPSAPAGLLALVGIILISSVAAFTGFQYGIRSLGPSRAGLFMYLMTPFGVLLAIALLGEKLETYHLVGIALVATGIIATILGAKKVSA
ncbi:MAG: DMT family transporter [Pseudomonadota bacterium]